MPYPNEHSCRLNNPDKYDRLRRENCAQKHDEKCIDVIYGVKDNKSEIQAMRYDKEIWTEESARNHCKEREGKFEPANEEKKAMPPTIERRTFELDNIEVRTDGDEEQPKIIGHAAVFNKLSEVIFGFREQVAPGAFSKSIKRDDIRALFNHDPNYVLGRNKAGTLKLEEDDKGLAIEIDPPDTSFARDLMVSIKRGDINQMSFAFQPDGKKGEEWDNSDPDKPIRTLKTVRLYDVSPVTYPAYLQTDVAVRTKLISLGIDYDNLSEALAKGRANMNEEDFAAVRKAVDILQGYLDEAGVEKGTQDSQELIEGNERLDYWRRELKVAAHKTNY